MPDSVKILVVDDSAYMRVVLRDMLESEEGLTVVDTAKDGVEALEKVERLRPDIVLLDIQMPRMDGLTTLQMIMKNRPTRVVMLSAMDKLDGQLPLRALSQGAVDFIPKPSGTISIDIINYKARIANHLRTIARAKLDALKMESITTRLLTTGPEKTPDVRAKTKAIVLAASTGGPRALETVFSILPKNLPASMFIVQHLPIEFSTLFAKRLDSVQGPSVRLAVDGVFVENDTTYLAPGGTHLILEPKERKGIMMKLDDGPPVQFVRPSANILFETAARCYGQKLLGIVLTGMGSDSAKGAEVIKRYGGRVIVQNEESSVIFGMANAVIRAGAADEVLPLDDIPRRMIDFIEE
ncbi:MAG: chemotaxis response regulator protein-glutamate methylesterase [Candidatus Thermoplasmatota archaeon]|nr:chemotaxis response regulator protein-glutamate methylesterase [Candidatus Thermoplasmatota archaeon]